jgi:uncharacterized protein YggE
MSAVFLAIIIMGGVAITTLKVPLIGNVQTTQNVQPTDLKTTGSLTAYGIVPNLVSPSNDSLIAIRNMTIVPADRNPSTMSLSGVGKVTVQANQAIIILGVYTEGKSAQDAEQENALKMTDVVNSLNKLGIPQSDIQTIGYTINPEYDYTYKITVGYQVTDTLQIRVTDLTKIGSIIDTTSNAGANTISSVTFTVSDDKMAEYKLQAYAEAVKDVQAKAKTITEGFGVSIVGIQSINENYYYPIYQNVYTAMDTKGMSSGSVMPSTPIISGTLDISVTLNVVYLLN